MPEGETLDLVAGDIGRARIFEFEGVEDLVAVTAIEAHVWRPSDRGGTSTTLPADIIDAPNRLVRVRFGDAVDDWLPALGAVVTSRQSWRLELEVSSPTASAITSPEGDPVIVYVRPQGG